MRTELNQWVNCPINLSTREIEDPFIVIDDFFSADDLSGHIDYLEKWRDRVIGPGYYIDLKGSPFESIWQGRSVACRLFFDFVVAVSSANAHC